MKRQITIADIFIVVLLGVLLPFSPLIRPRQSMAIGDKVVVYIHQRPSDDSLCHALQLTNDEIEEMRYYLRNHDVADEGYNIIASYHTKLLQHHRFLETLLLKDSMYYLPSRQMEAIGTQEVSISVRNLQEEVSRGMMKEELSGHFGTMILLSSPKEPIH